MTTLERFATHYIPVTESGCWLWTSGDNGRYGKFSINRNGKRQRVLAHRFSYEQFVGPLGKDLEVDHLCFVKLCVNPAHLELVTRGINFSRAVEAGRMQSRRCTIAGHETYYRNNWKLCRTCKREREKIWIRNKRAQRREQTIAQA